MLKLNNTCGFNTTPHIVMPWCHIKHTDNYTLGNTRTGHWKLSLDVKEDKYLVSRYRTRVVCKKKSVACQRGETSPCRRQITSRRVDRQTTPHWYPNCSASCCNPKYKNRRRKIRRSRTWCWQAVLSQKDRDGQDSVSHGDGRTGCCDMRRDTV